MSSSTSTSTSEVWIGLIFWALVIGAGLYFYIDYTKEDRGEILLNVSAQPELVSGLVMFEGIPVHEGTLHIVVTEARKKRYRAGITLPVKDGKFSSKAQPSLGITDTSRAWLINAEFRGRAVHKEDGRSKFKVVSASTRRYINISPPLRERFLWSVGSVMAVLLLFQLVLFTGDLGARKARLLFVLMYFFTFLSLALPIAVSLMVAQHEDLVQSMEASPIGLVKAKTEVLSEPQWLLNIGGTVRESATVLAVAPAGSAAVRTSPPATASASAVQAERTVEDDAAKSPGGGITSPPATASASAVQAERTVEDDTAESLGSGMTSPPVTASAAVIPSEKTVKGGVAVPFYVVLLAMFGAGINMTLKVPVIQRSYEDVLSEGQTVSLLLNPWKLFSRSTEPPVSQKTAGDIRRDLIENFMYLLSAPLLAIAMYYLLQILAEEVTQPVLVLMAFATGLVSKAVVGGIIEFAESRLLTRRGREAESSEVAKALAEVTAKQTDAEAAERALTEAKTRLAAAEAAARTAEEAAQRTRAIPLGDSELAKQEAEKMVAAKRAEVAVAQEATAEAAKVAEAKQAEARKAVSAAERAQALEAEAAAKAAEQAEVKQSEARTAAEATEEAAKAATDKQAEAQAAVAAAVQPPQAVAEDKS